MKILDCSDYKSALISASNVLSLSQEKLIEMLQRIPDSQDLAVYHSQYFHETLQQLNYKSKQLNAIWFHGTRVINVDSFFVDGLRPKSEAYEILTPLLKELSSNIECKKSSTSTFALSKAFKSAIGTQDEGPFATLFKQKAQRKDYPFHAMPEAVEDIAEGLVGANYQLVTEKFTQITRPAIIEFVGYAYDADLEKTLYYLHQVIHGESETDTACRIDSFFKGDGKTIPSEKIKAVHFLDKNEIVQNMNFAIPNP